MPEKITYEEILIENLTKAVKDVVEQINENDLWSKATTHNSPMHDSPKGDGDIQKVTRPKAEKVAEKNPVGGELKKAPPVDNPRREEYDNTPNDDLSREEHIELFREIADPIIERAAKNLSNFAWVPLAELKMSPKKALKVAKDLYRDMDYRKIRHHSDRTHILFDMRRKPFRGGSLLG